DTATTEIYTLSLHDALPICRWVTTEPRTSRGSPVDSRSAITHTPYLSVRHCQIMTHGTATSLDLQGVSRRQSVPGHGTCSRDRPHQDAFPSVTPGEPHPIEFDVWAK